MTPPSILKYSMVVGFSMKSRINLMPNPVIKAYIKSLTDAPTPVTKPYHRPLFRVRCTVRIPTGPIGALATMPMTIPCSTRSITLSDCTHIIFVVQISHFFSN